VSPPATAHRGRIVDVEPAPLSRVERVALDWAYAVTLEALAGVRAGRLFPAVCVIAHCHLCHGAFNPLAGPCGSSMCPRCLREWLPAPSEVCCSRCGPSQRGLCPIARSAEEERHAGEAREAGGT
jgi:hypothetical protein